MMLKFKTCDVSNALRFLQTGYPNRILNRDTCPILCDALDKDIVRVMDPNFHALAIESTPGNEDLLQKIKTEVEATPIKDKP